MNGAQSALDPAGPYAQRLHDLFSLFTIVCAFVWIAVIVALLFAIRKARKRETPEITEAGWRSSLRWVASAMAVGIVWSSDARYHAVCAWVTAIASSVPAAQ